MGGGGGGAAGGADTTTGGGMDLWDIFGGDCFLGTSLFGTTCLEYPFCRIGRWSPSLKVDDVSVLELSIFNLGAKNSTQLIVYYKGVQCNINISIYFYSTTTK